jgi:hypothetical protein
MKNFLKDVFCHGPMLLLFTLVLVFIFLLGLLVGFVETRRFKPRTF